MHLRFTSAGASLLAIALLVGGVAHVDRAAAQATSSTAATAPAAANSDELAEIVVTANHREENNQTVPIAITAISGDTATKLGVTNLESLGDFVPGAVFERQSNGSIPFIRGVGNPNSTSGDEPSVATYVDDVYLPFPGAGVSNYNSIDRIEVEKGPQGTQFGRNATGGVIQIHTKDPTPDPTLDFSAGYANFDTYSASVYASGAIGPNLSANIASYWSRQYDGWGHNLTTGDPSYRQWDAGGRVKFLWTPTDQTTVLVAFDTDVTVLEEGLDYRAFAGTDSEGAMPAPSGFYDYYSPEDDHGKLTTDGVSAKVTQDFGWASLVSISAFRHSENPAIYNLALGNGLFNEPTDIVGKDDTYTQEFRLLSPNSGKLKWSAGLFYFNDVARYDPLNIEVVIADLNLNNDGVQRTASYAGFTDATYELLPATHVTLGARYTEDYRKAQGALYIDGGYVPPGGLGPGAPGGSGSTLFTDWSGRAILDHYFTDDIMGYGGWNRGFKSGLYNLAFVTGSINPPVKPETIDAFTLGEKAEFLDHKLRVNTEFFYDNWTNIQVQEVVANASQTTNAAGAKIKGVDLDITALPMERLSVVANFEFLDGYFTNFPNGAYNVYNPAAGGDCTLAPNNLCGLEPGSPYLPPHFVPGTATTPASWNLAGNKTPNSPPFSATFSARYTVPTAYGPVDVNIALNHTGDYFWQADNGKGQQPPSMIDNAKQPTLNLVNASVGWTSADNWSVRLWGKNLTNIQYYSFGFETAPATQYSAAPPRTFGITFSKHFGR
jgi:iron complex outermembrane recepter protein